MTILTILTLHVPADRSDDVIGYYRTARILDASGASWTQLGTKTDDAGTLVVIATWPDAAAYEVWQKSPARGDFSRGILDAADGSVTATSEVFQVAMGT
ncbi:putative quinol monooxygenase [Microbacterium natoriense]